MTSKRSILCLVIVLGHLTSPAQVSREDIAQVTPYLMQQARPIAGNVDRFTVLTSPYAPLDFQVRQANTKVASSVRNYLFGAASAAAGLDKEVALKIANDFHCGQPCATRRIRDFEEQHSRVTSLIMKFVPLVGLTLVAQWGVAGDFRVNDTFVRDGTITSFKPSGPLEIVPGSAETVAPSLNAATGLTQEELAQAEAFAAELASLHLAALVRSPQGIRVIRRGNADNQSGLLFKGCLSLLPKRATLLAKD